MKKVYCLVDKHFGKVIAASKKREALEEECCDIFFENFWQDMTEAADSHWINVENPSEDCREFARDCWDRIMIWNKEVYEIQKVYLS